MSRIRILLSATLACSALASGAIGAGQAQASTSSEALLRGLDRSAGTDHPSRALAQLQTLGVKALRVELNWYSVAPAPTSATKPKLRSDQPR